MSQSLLAGWPPPALLALLLATAAAVLAAGIRLTRTADRLADVTGLGEAVFGAVLLGGGTSLSGLVTSVTAAHQGYPVLAVSNSVGGIAVQTAFLAVADLSYRRANLEHAAASAENMLQGALLCALLSLIIIGTAAPDVAVLGVHPVSFLLFGAYVAGLRLVHKARSEPAWYPRRTDETRTDEPDEPPTTGGRKIRLWFAFVGLAVAVSTAGFVVAQVGIALIERLGISETATGVLLTAVITSLPELVTTFAAVRRGALTLAVGGIVGGNCFDVLFVAFSDIAYRPGSIYHAITAGPQVLIALTLLLTSVLLLGLLRREKSGIGNIGFESFLIILLYLGGMALVTYAG